MNTYKFQVPIQISKNNIDDIIFSALDSGITYWCDKVEVTNFSPEEDSESFVSDLVTQGRVLILYDKCSIKQHELDLTIILKGIELYLINEGGYKVLPDNMLDMVSIDATAADMIVQYGIFGEVIYG